MQDQKRNMQEKESQLAGRPSRYANANPAVNASSPGELFSKTKKKGAAANASTPSTIVAIEAAAPAPQPKGKGKANRTPSHGAREDGGKGGDKGIRYSHFFNNDPAGCGRSDKCVFSHASISAAEKNKIQRPASLGPANATSVVVPNTGAASTRAPSPTNGAASLL